MSDNRHFCKPLRAARLVSMLAHGLCGLHILYNTALMSVCQGGPKRDYLTAHNISERVAEMHAAVGEANPIRLMNMLIGIPRETKHQECRVALLPSSAYHHTQRGHQVLVERGAGEGSGYPDTEYELVGARLASDHAAVFHEVDLVVKVKEPQASELPLLRSGQILLT